MMLMLIAGVLPLVLFVLVDRFAGPKTAIWTAIVTSIAGYALFCVLTRNFDLTGLVEPVFIILMGGVSLRMQNPRLFKFQPAVVGVLIALVVAYFQYLGTPIALRVMPLLPEEVRDQLSQDPYPRILALFSGQMIWLFLLHAALMAYVALRSSNFWWLAARLAIYPMLMIAMIFDVIAASAG